VAGPGELDSARLRRDLSLALRRRLTWYAAVGAAGLTVVFSIIAAASPPGKTGPIAAPAATPATQPDPFFGQDTQQPGDNQPGIALPAQLPQGSSGGSPVAISGGS
jgi:hypothetical protein